jgi:hypothetical protein
MTLHDVGPVLIPVLFIAFAVGSIWWSRTRGLSLLENWARGQGYEILTREECWFFRGPYFWSTSKGQKVYKVSLKDLDGHVRTGFVRCGGYWLGMLSDDVDVRWDD